MPNGLYQLARRLCIVLNQSKLSDVLLMNAVRCTFCASLLLLSYLQKAEIYDCKDQVIFMNNFYHDSEPITFGFTLFQQRNCLILEIAVILH